LKFDQEVPLIVYCVLVQKVGFIDLAALEEFGFQVFIFVCLTLLEAIKLVKALQYLIINL